jgi:prepilin-type N-terminal cleavage/methylation domain-containing protein/prepilin-type processing-associated H-X9-DG protein
MKRSAFTLIELLVVIAIIALLAAIAIPVYGNVMEKGSTAKCLANLRQVGQGVMIYLQDNDDDFFPRAGGKSWPITLHDRYRITWKVFHSPFDKRPQQETGTVPVSYGLNSDCFDTNVGKWDSPADLIMGAAAPTPGGAQINFTGTSTQNVDVSPGSGNNGGTHANRKRINVLYGDGRVESMLWKDYSNSGGQEGDRRWKPDWK